VTDAASGASAGPAFAGGGVVAATVAVLAATTVAFATVAAAAVFLLPLRVVFLTGRAAASGAPEAAAAASPAAGAAPTCGSHHALWPMPASRTKMPRCRILFFTVFVSDDWYASQRGTPIDGGQIVGGRPPTLLAVKTRRTARLKGEIILQPGGGWQSRAAASGAG
jgi:hypothetical protein